MSRVAGIILIVYGIAAAYVGINEFLHPDQLTTFAMYGCIAVGVLLFLAGVAHFTAPHKAFLMSIPLVLYFQFQAYVVTQFYLEDARWVYQGGLFAVSLVVLFLSYLGYPKQQT